MTGSATTVLRWPLWSWRNLSATTAVILLVFYGMGRVVEPAKIALPKAGLPSVIVSSASAQPSDPSVVASSTMPATIPSATSTASAFLDVDTSDSMTRLATAFAQAWSYTARSQQAWVRGIRPYVTPALAVGLAQTDPARVPATRVTGEAVLLTASATSAQVRVPTDGGSIVVTLRQAPHGPWLISEIAPAGQPPSAPTPDLGPRTTPARN